MAVAGADAVATMATALTASRRAILANEVLACAGTVPTRLPSVMTDFEAPMRLTVRAAAARITIAIFAC